MGYKALQKLWTPAGSGYGDSPNITPTLREHKILDYRYNSQSGLTEISEASDLMTTAESTYVNNRKINIEFYSIASAESAKFVPMDVEYSEDFNSEWNHQNVYGRNDPLSTFQGTKRTISLQFIVNATSPYHARLNMLELANLASLMYPTYKNAGISTSGSGYSNFNNASLIHTAPLLKVHFNNLIVDPSSIGYSDKGANGMAKEVGLVCAAGDLKIAPVMENGVVIAGGLRELEATRGFPTSDPPPKDSRIYPKTWKVSTSLTVFHTFPMGYERNDGVPTKGGPNAYDRGVNGFGSFPWGEKHVYDQVYVSKKGNQDARKAARAAIKLFKR